MVNRFIRNILIGLSKVRVLHSIPGRLRLKIDGLEKSKYFFKENRDISLNFDFYKLYGIKNIEFSPHTSNILIEYDPEILDEKSVIKWVTRLHETIIQKFMSGVREINQQVIDDICSALLKEGYEMEKFKQGPPA